MCKTTRRHISRGTGTGKNGIFHIQRSQVIQEVVYPLHVDQNIVVNKSGRVRRIVHKNNVTRIAGDKQVTVFIYRSLVQTPTHRRYYFTASIGSAVTPAPTNSIFTFCITLVL